jgi:hypothetical protein
MYLADSLSYSLARLSLQPHIVTISLRKRRKKDMPSQSIKVIKKGLREPLLRKETASRPLSIEETRRTWLEDARASIEARAMREQKAFFNMRLA